MRIKSLSHAGITVSSIEKSARWYWDVFKMPLVSVSELTKEEVEAKKDLYRLEDCSVRLGFLLCPKGGVVEIFEFSRTEAASHRWNAPGVTHFTLDAKNIKKWHAKLSARDDVDVLCPPQTTDGNEWFFFRDPDGNLIELIDLKFNYFLMRRLGKLAGFLMRKGPYKSYYSSQLSKII
ncbi:MULTISPECIES: VOC family protein [unclassified Oceanispirochaeta]|uniref:VOC family protein n=1 Tax=unclassified Oceanispirochaeta TaxID=2635722 RepID=UPI000E090BF7|nr:MULTISPECIES: VOC family protein [unclassified Oceanispirochaeta]MBF9018196.1 VOC family protein [Oceanispirochaeta sp. M2]NPD74698.1 VOC family protein [Oceanispirochaeta sp. M1]RDG29490.1 VOC family protein [Oceanispirochaeta sp. M1]